MQPWQSNPVVRLSFENGVTEMKEILELVIGKDEPIVTKKEFRVEEQCACLGIEHDVPLEYGFLMFLVIQDPLGNVRFQKQLGCSEPMISIGSSAKDTTIGGVPGKIPMGIWSMNFYVFSEHIYEFLGNQTALFHFYITDRSLPVTEVIGGPVWVGNTTAYDQFDYKRIYQPESKWYKGDLHTHTRLSDGKELPENASKKANQMGLDYYIPTEHNVIHTGWSDTDVMILPGVEITTRLGHANLFGIDKRPDAMDALLIHKEEALLKTDLLAVVKECRERNWLFSVNHPFLYVWKWLMDELPLEDINCLEIINDPTYAADPNAQADKANQKAVFLADALWEDGYRICAVGGSDSHKEIDDFYEGANEPSIPGDPATWLYMDGLSPDHLLEALRNCRCYVTRYCEVRSKFAAYGKEVCFGSQLDEKVSRFSYELNFGGLTEEPVIFYIQDGEKHFCEDVRKLKDGSYDVSGEINIQDKEYTWIRFGAQKRDGGFLFYGNPITRGKKQHQFKTFGQIRKYVEQQWK